MGRILILVLLTIVFKTQAQYTCGTSSPSNDELNHLLNNIYTKDKVKNLGTTCVAMKPFVVRESNGSGGVTMQQLNELISHLNYAYLDAGIEFYWVDFPSYLNNSDLYAFNSTSPDNDDDNQLSNSFPTVSNAINVFFVNTISLNQFEAGGYAYFPYGDDPAYNKIVLGKTSLDYDVTGKVIKHEIGHYFALLHTFQGTEYGPHDLEAENVPRTGPNSNCGNFGDYLCDTPADPGYTQNNFNDISCEYTGTAMDKFGNIYTPLEDNIMSYFPYHCAKKFTQEQNDRIQLGLTERQSYNSYSIDGQPSNVNTPTNLMASVQAGRVVLNWQDNATNEMGYIVEISEISNNAEFISLEKNATIENATSITISNYNFDLNTPYYFRIKATNAACNNYSNVAQVIIDECVPSSNDCITIISQFKLGDIDNLSNFADCNQNSGYSNYDSIISNVFIGQTYPFHINLDGPIFLAADTVAVWVDWNEDGDFLDTNEFIYKNSGASNYSSDLIVPQGISFGDKKIRIRTAFNEALYPCGVDNEGEAEDYILRVLDPTACIINNITLGNQINCNLLDNTYSQEVFVHYQNEPNTGFLNVNNIDYNITGSPQKIIIDNIMANTGNQDVSVFFTDEITCQLNNSNFIQTENCIIDSNERSLYVQSFPSDLGSIFINSYLIGSTPFLGVYTLNSNLEIDVTPNSLNTVDHLTLLSTNQNFYVLPIVLTFHNTDTIHVYYNQSVNVQNYTPAFNSFNLFPTVFDNQINIEFELKESVNIGIDLFSIDGKLIENLFQQEVFSGIHYKEKFTMNISSGIYFIRVSSETSSFIQKIVKY